MFSLAAFTEFRGLRGALLLRRQFARLHIAAERETAKIKKEIAEAGEKTASETAFSLLHILLVALRGKILV